MEKRSHPRVTRHTADCGDPDSCRCTGHAAFANVAPTRARLALARRRSLAWWMGRSDRGADRHLESAETSNERSLCPFPASHVSGMDRRISRDRASSEFGVAFCALACWATRHSRGRSARRARSREAFREGVHRLRGLRPPVLVIPRRSACRGNLRDLSFPPQCATQR
jgi:hypothetical protein